MPAAVDVPFAVGPHQSLLTGNGIGADAIDPVPVSAEARRFD